jgi:hypothetical protein
VSVRAWTGSGYAPSLATDFRKADGIWQREPATKLQTT